MACLEGLPGENFFSLKRPWQHSLHLQSCSEKRKHKAFETMSFEET